MISLIAGLNSVQYVNVDNLLPNPENTLSKDIEFEGVVKNRKYQKFLKSETVTTQIKTNYIVTGGDTLTATLIDCEGVKTPLLVSLAASFVDALDSTITAFYQFDVVGQTDGIYTIEIKGFFDGNSKYKQSEPFELVTGEEVFRTTPDGNLPYTIIPNHYKIVAKNNENQEFNYWADGFEVVVWAEGASGKPQSGGEDDVYNNLGNLSKLESIDQHIYELKTSDIPQYLILKIQGLFGLDFVTMNDLQYVTTESGEAEYFGNYTAGVLTINLTQAFVEGINSDDQGFIPNDTDMNSVIPVVIANKSGDQQASISGGYAINQITIEPTQGISVTVQIGFTPAGNEILRSTTVLTADVVENIARNYVNPLNPSASYLAYVQISGVGAAANVTIQTIINKQ